MSVFATAVARHPRYSVVLVFLLALITFLLLPQSSYHAIKLAHNEGPSSLVSDPVDYFRNRASLRPLQAILQEQEELYKFHLQRREGLVKKYGPTAAQVEAFPSNGQFYTLWDFFLPAFQCPHRVERIGNLGDGGKWMCGFDRVARQRDCVIYSFGLNGEVSFEAELLSRAPNCQIWGYDFSVSSIGSDIEHGFDRDNRSLASRAHFKPYALTGTDEHASTPPKWTLKSLLQANGHKFIDVLKIDIESWEFEALEPFVREYIHSGEPLPVGQMQIEIHATESSGYGTFEKFRQWWEELEKAGLRPFWTEPNMVYMNIIRGARPDLVEYSFMNIRGEHALVSDKWIS
ncbi:methyltransferase domain-containing protein [Cristinia sonorae]|uniref:Methyltransferase domain-containing protein n=1 Tax=Cristinia sonorae TaxID=1940300 RepID=A0A8K0XK31_9AGAR|nr:methyltransferase domain-containing protein [Cristinia sonorae]